MTNLAVIGTGWGDEGKGKIVDMLSEQVDVVVRYAGGNNAGHTLVRESGEQIVLHLVPSGVLHPGKIAVLGDGMVIDPKALIEELDFLRSVSVELSASNLLVSSRAHLILPYHQIMDELREGTHAALGTTRRGIGPAYEDKAARRGIRAGDLLRPSRLEAHLEATLNEANQRIERLGGQPMPLAPLLTELQQLAERLKPHIVDTHRFIHHACLQRGRSLLFEGAQGALLDLDHGTYPFVTSSNTVGGGIFSAVGIGAQHVDGVVGIVKAYATRVGDGPFPSEISGAAGEALRQKGAEFGATTGRPRRCGWLDLVALRYAVEVSGVRWLALTKLDILAGISPLMVCSAYELDGVRIEHFPDDADDLSRVQPVLEEIEGFTGDLARAKEVAELPTEARRYVERIEKSTGVEVRWISVGPSRHQTLTCGKTS